MFRILERTFLPSFCYSFVSGLPSPGLLERVPDALRELDGKLIASGDRSILLEIPSSRVFSFIAPGRLVVEIIENEPQQWMFRTWFESSRNCFLVFVSALSLIILLSALTTQEFLRLLFVPVLFASGHLYFWATLIPRAERLRRFLVRLC